MARLLALFLGFLSVCEPLQAEAPPVVARVVPELSLVEERWIGGTVLRLGLDAGVPYRVFNLNDPPRLVMDFRNVAFDGLTPTDMLSKPGRITALQFGSFAPGWSRLVAELSGPFPAEDVEMKIDPQTGQALLEVRLGPESQETFDTVVNRNRPDPWETEQAPQSIPPAAPEERFVVVIDPGHGGIDPGAISGDLQEKDLMLGLARALRDALRRSVGNVDVYLTRDADLFVSLPARLAFADQVQADLFLSLHADAIAQGRAQGATVYTLAEEASDKAAERLASQLDRSDIIAGLDLQGADDEVVSVLDTLVRRETEPRTAVFAEMLVDALRSSGLRIHPKPWRQADFSVLKSASIPSVLLEVGFLSDAQDRASLSDEAWRDKMVNVLAQAVLRWHQEDETMRGLMRQ
jgi:N-acetylmuramoyl-L-alanine amidase